MEEKGSGEVYELYTDDSGLELFAKRKAFSAWRETMGNKILVDSEYWELREKGDAFQVIPKPLNKKVIKFEPKKERHVMKVEGFIYVLDTDKELLDHMDQYDFEYLIRMEYMVKEEFRRLVTRYRERGLKELPSKRGVFTYILDKLVMNHGFELLTPFAVAEMTTLGTDSLDPE
ncbi:hypothetical protein D1872_81840 [compost metagenome]